MKQPSNNSDDLSPIDPASEYAKPLSERSMDNLVSVGAMLFTRIIDGDPLGIPHRLCIEREQLLTFLSLEGAEIAERMKKLSVKGVKGAYLTSQDLRRNYKKVKGFIVPRRDISDMSKDTTKAFPILTDLINLLFSALATDLDFADSKKKKIK